METLVWLVIGVLAGAAAALAVRGGRAARLQTIGTGVVAALVGGLVVDALVGDFARVRVSFIRGDSFAIVGFGLAPALGASLAAVVAIVAFQRVHAGRQQQPSRRSIVVGARFVPQPAGTPPRPQPIRREGSRWRS